VDYRPFVDTPNLHYRRFDFASSDLYRDAAERAVEEHVSGATTAPATATAPATGAKGCSAQAGGSSVCFKPASGAEGDSQTD
jgi:hypothetical protein